MIFGFPAVEFVFIVSFVFFIGIVSAAVAVESVSLLVPVMVFVLPATFTTPPNLTFPQAAGLGLAVDVAVFAGAVGGYWYRGTVDFTIAKPGLLVVIPAALLGRIATAWLSPGAVILGAGVVLVFVGFAMFRHSPTPSLDPCILCGDPLVPLPDATADPGPHPDVDVELAGEGDTSRGEAPGGGDSADDERDDFEFVGEMEDVWDERDRPERPDAVTDFYHARTRLFDPVPEANRRFELPIVDRLVLVTGGLLTGVSTIGTAGLTNGVLSVRRRIPLSLSTGTSSLVVLVALMTVVVTDLLLGLIEPSGMSSITAVPPFRLAVLASISGLLGGLIGSDVGSRLPVETRHRLAVVAYIVFGLATFTASILATGIGP